MVQKLVFANNLERAAVPAAINPTCRPEIDQRHGEYPVDAPDRVPLQTTRQPGSNRNSPLSSKKPLMALSGCMRSNLMAIGCMPGSMRAACKSSHAGETIGLTNT